MEQTVVKPIEEPIEQPVVEPVLEPQIEPHSEPEVEPTKQPEEQKIESQTLDVEQKKEPAKKSRGWWDKVLDWVDDRFVSDKYI